MRKLLLPARRLIQALYPARCVFCQGFLPSQETGLGVCPSCKALLPYLRDHRQTQFGRCLSACRSPLLYAGPVKESVRRYKFANHPGYAAPYGQILRTFLEETALPVPDLLTWAPLHPFRKMARGYDQARLLAEEVGKGLGCSPVRLVKKVRNVRPQSSLSPKERMENVKGCYRLVRNPPPLQGRHILLVDDVVTTGSTLEACAKVLLEAGAGEVSALTLARSAGGSIDTLQTENDR